jgi:predicted Na+-dependent transporter
MALNVMLLMELEELNKEIKRNGKLALITFSFILIPFLAYYSKNYISLHPYIYTGLIILFFVGATFHFGYLSKYIKLKQKYYVKIHEEN